MDGLVRDMYRRCVDAWGVCAQEAELEHFARGFAYDSGAIENDAITRHDTYELFDNGRLIGFTGDVRTVFEMWDLRQAWRWTRDFVAREGDVTTDAILELHAILCHGTYDEARLASGERPGTYKIGNYVVADDVGYPPEDVEGAMDELTSELRDAMGARHRFERNALTVAAYAHAMLVEIHPFADGNGRCARQLMNMVLLSAGHPPVNVPESDRMAYYGALDEFHKGGSLDGMRDFLMAECARQWAQRLRVMEPGRDPLV